jgi:hypothetical protein
MLTFLPNPGQAIAKMAAAVKPGGWLLLEKPDYISAAALRPSRCASSGIEPPPQNAALAIASATRSELLPDIPIMADYVPGVEASIWYGIVAPKNTPAAIVDKLNKEINATLTDPRMKARFADLNFTVLPGSPAEFGRFIAEDTEKWRKVVKFAGLKAE